MKLEIKNILNENNSRWVYKGKVTHNNKTYLLTGSVPKLRTQGMIKKAIIDDVRRQVEERIKQKKARTKTLSLDGNFVSG